MTLQKKFQKVKKIFNGVNNDLIPFTFSRLDPCRAYTKGLARVWWELLTIIQYFVATEVTEFTWY